jgi:hypothetical protein
MRPYLKKPFTKIGLVEWLKVKALSSSPSTAKKKKKKPYQIERKSERQKKELYFSSVNTFLLPFGQEAQIFTLHWDPQILHIPLMKPR